MLRFILIITFVCFSSATAHAKDETMRWDGQQYSFQANRVVVIGDLHGDFVAFVKILTEKNLIDKNGNWSGGDTHLVLMGDLNDRGPDHRLIIEMVMRLQEQSLGKFGRVHALLGNHELMLVEGDLRYVSAKEYLSFSDFLDPKGKEVRGDIDKHQAMQRAFTAGTRYGDWLATRPSMVVINDTLYVHAGVEGWALDHHPGRMNTTIRSWIQFFQGGRKRPDKKTQWVVGDRGPLWTWQLSEEKLSMGQVDKILAKLSVKRIVVGHTITDGHKIKEIYGGKVILVDTAISLAMGGELSVLELLNDGKLNMTNKIYRPKTSLVRYGEIFRLDAEACFKMRLF